MARRRYLNQKQLAVLDDLFTSDLDEQAVLDKHKVRRSTYEKWLADKLFVERFKRYVNGLKRRSELLMAKYSCLAAAKLVELTASDKAETARKACLDIISVPKIAANKDEQADKTQKDSDREAERLSAETASKILAALAEPDEKGETTESDTGR
jgi:hypothetical protein